MSRLNQTFRRRTEDTNKIVARFKSSLAHATQLKIANQLKDETIQEMREQIKLTEEKIKDY